MPASFKAVQRFLDKREQKIQYRKLYDNFIQNMNEKEFRHYRLALNTPAGLRLVLPSEIVYCEGENNYTRIFLADGMMIHTSRTIKEYEQTLRGHEIIRVHKSYLVNLLYVTEYNNEHDTILLKNEKLIPVSRRKKSEVLELLKGCGR